MRLHLPLAFVGFSVLAFATPSFAKDDPEAKTVVCKDGSTATGGRGACRGHGGVDKAATAKTAGGAAAAATEAKGESAKESMEKGHAKAAAKADEKAAEVTVVCKDGSTAKGGRGACRGHGGVDEAATAKAAGGPAAAATEAKGEKAKESMEKGQAKAAAKADEKVAGMTVVCKDGSTSPGGRGACRGHGGVDKAATAKATGGSATTAVPATPPAMPPAATPAVPPTPATPSARATPPVPAAPGAAAPQRAEQAMDKKGPPTARCKDGTFSYAKHHTGACARHGGVEEWLDKTEQK